MNTHPRLPRRKSRYILQRSGNQVIPKFIPDPIGPCDPLQRWRNSPPEDEPASMSAIADAIHKSEDAGGRIYNGKDRPPQGPYPQFCHYRRPNSLASSNSGSSASSWPSVTSTRSATTQDPLAPQDHVGHRRIHKNRQDQKKPDDASKRIFCCTFCCDRFKNKYDWVHHEKSLHLNLDSWVCAPHGVAPISPLTGRRQCAYCLCLEPSVEHLDQHSSQLCSDGTRTFRRKDHLVQHLRQCHQLNTIPPIADWKTPSPTVTSRCGFCSHRLINWDERSEHLASHFREGLTMNEWRGDHDLPASIASKITNALPVYLIGSESKTMVPFSATNATVKDHFAQISRRADSTIDATVDTPNEASLESSFQQLQSYDTPLHTFTEILTSHLARYSRKQMSLGILPTDEMFQQESRRLLYDSENPWNQTIADNPEWIFNFKRQYIEQTDSAESTGQTAPHAMEPPHHGAMLR
ncbi:Zinc finger C2H2 [Penicillium coprophilum]|uniref:Zinc finger C2H2 n=1 Tax=Penicillium coprophilum TaxID=36646 RepID=UPI0023836A00|nr:Zinc finger C2H2 [Penicillium coprophilum]KAJ5158031.1 Zinc finger C2H2 [Penicillium coprophilum]